MKVKSAPKLSSYLSHCSVRLFLSANLTLSQLTNCASKGQMLKLLSGAVFQGGVGKAMGRVLSLSFDSGGHILWTGDDRGYIVSFLFDMATAKLTKAKRC